LPDGFWNEPLVVRQALFVRQVLRHYVPVQILAGELVVGSHFSTALSRCLKKDEARERDKQEAAFLKEWHTLNDIGVGNCAAVPGHLVPDYPKALQIGWKGIQDEAQAVAANPANTREQRDLARAIVICADAVCDFTARYSRSVSLRSARAIKSASSTAWAAAKRLTQRSSWRAGTRGDRK